MHVGVLNGIVRQAQLFGAEDQGHRLVEGQGVGREVVAMRTSGHNLIAFVVQTLKNLRRVELLIIIMV